MGHQQLLPKVRKYYLERMILGVKLLNNVQNKTKHQVNQLE